MKSGLCCLDPPRAHLTTFMLSWFSIEAVEQSWSEEIDGVGPTKYNHVYETLFPSI